jgi:hypothetical protein
MFAAVHLFNCTDEAERELFQTALAGQLETNMFVDGERVSIDYLAVVMEGTLRTSCSLHLAHAPSTLLIH